jgi:hypothetical protein
VPLFNPEDNTPGDICQLCTANLVSIPRSGRCTEGTQCAGAKARRSSKQCDLIGFHAKNVVAQQKKGAAKTCKPLHHHSFQAATKAINAHARIEEADVRGLSRQ